MRPARDAVILAAMTALLCPLRQATAQEAFPAGPTAEANRQANAAVMQQPGPADKLYDEIKQMDAALSEAFNTHDIGKLKALFAEDLEFYQDNEGLARYEQTVKDFESLFAQDNKIRRQLVEGSLEVYPIKDYGAIEIGAHQFCHLENGKDECGTFRFVHLWRKSGGAWTISRVVSYAH